MNPETHTAGLGETVKAYRLYLGLSQRSMAERTGKDRRDYQRIENGTDRCPPGYLDTLEALTDEFDAHVDALLEVAVREDGLNLQIDYSDPALEWERLVAGRARVIAPSLDPTPSISLTLVGEHRKAG